MKPSAKTNKKERGSKIQPFIEKEFLIALGITVAAAGFNCKGCELWAKENTTSDDPKTLQSIIKSPEFGQYYLGENRVKEYRKLISRIWVNKDVKDLDHGGNSPLQINQQQSDLIKVSNWKVVDVSAWCPRKT
jgi:hypothetical protein